MELDGIDSNSIIWNRFCVELVIFQVEVFSPNDRITIFCIAVPLLARVLLGVILVGQIHWKCISRELGDIEPLRQEPFGHVSSDEAA